MDYTCIPSILEFDLCGLNYSAFFLTFIVLLFCLMIRFAFLDSVWIVLVYSALKCVDSDSFTRWKALLFWRSASIFCILLNYEIITAAMLGSILVRTRHFVTPLLLSCCVKCSQLCGIPNKTFSIMRVFIIRSLIKFVYHIWICQFCHK